MWDEGMESNWSGVAEGVMLEIREWREQQGRARRRAPGLEGPPSQNGGGSGYFDGSNVVESFGRASLLICVEDSGLGKNLDES